jgi:hypothetical protein
VREVPLSDEAGSKDSLTNLNPQPEQKLLTTATDSNWPKIEGKKIEFRTRSLNLPGKRLR